jgi:hypothetical protein
MTHYLNRDTLKRLRSDLDEAKKTGVFTGSLDDLEEIVADRERHSEIVDSLVAAMQDGSIDALGAAMASDFARNRERGE